MLQRPALADRTNRLLTHDDDVDCNDHLHLDEALALMDLDEDEQVATPLVQQPTAQATRSPLPQQPRRQRTPMQLARDNDTRRARRMRAAAQRVESKELDLLVAAHDCSGSSAIADAMRFAHGRDDDLNWSKAAVEKDFVFPWKDRPAPSTEFRALCDDAYLYFTFRIEDADVFVLDKFRDEEDAVFEDRAEIYFVRDDRMRDYYCFEIDSRGRAFDYRGSYYRRFDPAWTWKGLETKASPLPQGYVVEGRIPLESFEALGFPKLRPGVKIRCGLYRAEFSHDRSGRTVAPKESIHNMGRRLDEPPPIEAWMSWVDPKTVDPDFHVPTSLGWLEIVDTVK